VADRRSGDAGTARATSVSAPAPAGHPKEAARLAKAAAQRESLAAAMPFNPLKAQEVGHENATDPPRGQAPSPLGALAGASTLSEGNESTKTGRAAVEPTVRPSPTLEGARTNAGGQALTTNQGVAIADNQNSLRAGLRGPTLMEDFILREKITHFDHERIPERIVHARGSAAHGYFEAYESLANYTRAAPFAAAGKITPVFTRFSTVAGERGSADTARDIRGFAVKFYTDEGNWDLVGNNIPVFFIQDAMKFPDLIHSVKPEPHNGIPQAASAHDTFWDFVSLMPESTHTLMWVMSDRGIPRSLRMMQGFGVHTFRLVNAQSESFFCKFHWKPLFGTHSLVWDEAVKLAGADPDFHRRDLWDSIEAGHFPEWELGLQIFDEATAAGFSFDVLDATKLIPEELVPVRPVGRMVLNRNPDNFFAETEQVAFCTAHVVPGIDFSNDPLLHGRIHSYLDTQITRLGGANFHELPINAPIVPVHNNQRDGIHRQAIARGRVAYEPNSLAGGCPFQAGAAGFTSFPAVIEAEDDDPLDKVRGKPKRFAEHYSQATLFYNSQTDVERSHIVAAFRFELSKVSVPAIRERMVASLRNVADDLASRVAEGLGMSLPKAMPRAVDRTPPPEVTVSHALSLLALPGERGVESRKVAILVAGGVDRAPLAQLEGTLAAAGATSVLVSVAIGTVRCADGTAIEAAASLENSPSVLYDAVITLDGAKSIATLAQNGRTPEFLKDQYRHGKTLFAIGASVRLLEAAGIPLQLDAAQPDPGLVVAASSQIDKATARFIAALARHRHPERDRDPPRL
jgi:catalase